MSKQIVFAIALLITLGIFSYTIYRLFRFMSFTRKGFRVDHLWKRFGVMMSISFGQKKIFRRPVIGFFHAIVFWGFCVILIGSIEMVIDGLTGTERVLRLLGPVYDFITASGDIFAFLIVISIAIFLSRRLFFHIKRFEGIEMKKISHIDANIALSLIMLLMLSLLGMNMGYLGSKNLSGAEVFGLYPASDILLKIFGTGTGAGMAMQYQVCWWTHILTIFVFANVLPYSKHFHVFLSVPNTFLSRLDPLGKLPNMDNITREVKLMMDPNAAFSAPATDAPVERFGVKDCEDVVWKTYFDSLTCTECGRCTSVCPANITGKKLSPRKVMMDLRARMKEKGPLMMKHGRDYSDGKSYIRDYISEEEIWACTTCNACARECPVNINHPTLIVEMRRYLVMEEASAPGELKAVFNNIENNGAPWQYSADDRLLWTKDLELNIQ